MTNSEDMTMNSAETIDLNNWLTQTDKIKKISKATGLDVPTILEIMKLTEMSRLNKTAMKINANLKEFQSFRS